MRNFKLDRLKFRWIGDWVSDFPYTKDDIVYYEGKSYVCLISHKSSDDFSFDSNETQDNTVELDVKVGIDTIDGQSQGKFYIDGEETPNLDLIKNRTYIFDQSDASNREFNDSRNILLISLGDDGQLAGNKDLSSGVKYFLDESEVDQETYITDFNTATEKRLQLTVSDVYPDKFYYYSVDNRNLGASITAKYDSYWELMFDGKNWETDWSTNTEYSIGSIVKFGGFVYECIASHTSTSVASLGVNADIDKWITVAATYNWRDNWQPLTNFSQGDVVRYNGLVYLCINSHFSASTEEDGLEDNQNDWLLFSRSDNWRQDWQTETKYLIGDTVKYGGIVYRCIENHVSAETESSGLEDDQANWEIVVSGVEYKQDWQEGFRYKENDIVKYGSTLWICIIPHSSQDNFRQTENNWEIWLPGLEYELEWSEEAEYQVGDIVYYGGYIYAALRNNTNSVPSANGLIQDTGDWELVTRSYNFKGNWIESASYRVGDVVRQSNWLYVARLDNESVYPDSSSAWELLIPGEVVVGEWQESTEYYRGDVVLLAGTAYLCVDRHNSDAESSRPDIDQSSGPTYWQIFVLGDLNNVLIDRGDIKTFDVNDVSTVLLKKDISFDIGSGFNNTVREIALQPDNKILVGGRFTDYDGTTQNKITRLNYDGSIDTTFDTGTGFNSDVRSIVIQDDGKIVVGGNFTEYNGTTQNRITRLNSDGSRDTEFDIGAGFDNSVNEIALQSNGKILAGGDFRNYDGTIQNRITRLNSDGSRDTEFDIGGGFSAFPSSIVVQPDDKILVGGFFGFYDGSSAKFIVRINTDGSIDTTFDTSTGFDNPVISVALQSNGKILAGGTFESYNGTTQNKITRLNSDGSIDTEFDIGSGFDAAVREIAIQPDDKILVGGIFTEYDGTTQNRITRLNSDGSLATVSDFGTGFNDEVGNIAIQSTNILMSGIFTEFDGTSANNLILFRIEGNNIKLPIGNAGNVLKTSDDGFPAWLTVGEIPNIFYVSPDGVDDNAFGTTLNSPFRTIKFATEYIFEDEENRTPATIFVKTGTYEEELPISLPRDVALVGDELRSTTVRPAKGFETSNMFYVRNGTGIRNMSLQGLKGELGELNEFLTRRPTAGAYVSLDPGSGPDDESVWITSKSCYVQNVSTLGEACIGMKIDGALHNGGNRSIVANDFTQILSDGIGYWADNVGRSELVSVFTYFCHIGYLSTNGGILRGTNGNNSYGLYGSVAEGFNEDETVKTARVNNRDNEAQFGSAFTFGTTEQKILAIGYEHAGENYTSASIEFGGTGSFAEGRFDEFRDGAISNVRILAPEDSSPAGGLNYTNVLNNAQSGSDIGIKLTTADQSEPGEYIGQRIVIESGLGVGQYAEITAYDTESKDAVISKESDGSLGWDHFQPGWPIEPVLDETTRYRIEPRIDVSEAPFSSSSINGVPNGAGWEHIIYGDSWVAVTGTADGAALFASTSTTGDSWSGAQSLSDNPAVGITYSQGTYFILPTSGTEIYTGSTTFTGSNVLPTDDNWLDIASDGDGKIVLISATRIVTSVDNGANFAAEVFVDNTFKTVGYGNGLFVIIDQSGDVLYSEDFADWEVSQEAVGSFDYKQIVYGNGRFVAISQYDSATESVTFARSFDGIDWYESVSSQGVFRNISYGDGVFIAAGEEQYIAKSQDGVVWRTFNDDSTFYTLSQSGVYRDSAYHEGKWIITESTGGPWAQVETGARPLIRAKMGNARIDAFEIFDPGSNYTAAPTLTIFDNSVEINALYEARFNNGVLPQPEMSNRGEGYVTASAEITGDGFAEIYQTGLSLTVSNLTDLPGPGANIDVAGIDDQTYSLTRLRNVTGSEGNYSADIDLIPSVQLFESPDHNTELVIREEYSQIRLTNHDFLDIGTGNSGTTRYPDLYLEGESPENSRKPFNQTVAKGGGRVFFSSTDQDGNFKVGELFEVEQSTGIVTISASQFDLSGLDELTLGGIQVGGTAVVIREFSRDKTFVADSNNIVPTEAAIAGFLESRIAGGSANAQANRLVSGQIQIDTNRITTTSGFPIEVPVKMVLRNGYEGKYLALQYFLTGANYDTPEE